VGKAALEGRPGVKKVTRGFRGLREINTVTYDPAVITVDEMGEQLRRAKTFIDIAP
jgi:hypothetical protein